MSPSFHTGIAPGQTAWIPARLRTLRLSWQLHPIDVFGESAKILRLNFPAWTVAVFVHDDVDSMAFEAVVFIQSVQKKDHVGVLLNISAHTDLHPRVSTVNSASLPEESAAGAPA